MNRSHYFIHCLAIALLAWAGSTAAFAQAAAFVPQALKRGVNVLGYDPIWKDPAQARFQLRHLALIREGGFDHVRLNLHAFEHMDAEDRLPESWFRTLDAITGAALRAGLQVIIDEHNFQDCAKDVAACRPRLKAFWRQVASRYRDAPDGVVFEILNEPNGQADAVWNEILAENLQIIRQTNPRRRVVVGPKMWNSLEQLDALKLPEADRHLVVTFHYYSPFPFTHQGAHWSPETKNLSGITWGKPQELEQLRRDFDRVKAWAERHDRPVLMGEFGALETAGMAQRVAWTNAVARAAEARGFGWSYWQFDSDFIVWDMKADAWVQPILHALMGIGTTAAAAPAARDPALDYLISVPQIGSWSFYGASQPARRVDCEATGRACLLLPLQGARTNPWDIGATVPLKGEIRKGDRIQILLWARLDTEDAKARATVPVSVQINAAPYTAAVSGQATLSGRLEPLVLKGTAEADFAADTLMLSVQLGQVGQPVWISAPYVLRNYPGKP